MVEPALEFSRWRPGVRRGQPEEPCRRLQSSSLHQMAYIRGGMAPERGRGMEEKKKGFLKISQNEADRLLKNNGKCPKKEPKRS